MLEPWIGHLYHSDVLLFRSAHKGRCASVVVFPAPVENVKDQKSKNDIDCDRNHILDELDTLLTLLLLLSLCTFDIINHVVTVLALVLKFIIFGQVCFKLGSY